MTAEARAGAAGEEDRTLRSLYRSWVADRVRNADTDQQGHVNHAVLTSYFETGRLNLIGAEERPLLDEGTDIMVVRLLMEFHRELSYPAAADIGTRVARIGRTSIAIDQAIFEGAACIATAQAVCVLVDRRSRRPTPVPDRLRAHLAAL